MASVAPMSHNAKSPLTRKAPSPYRVTPVKNLYAKSPSKVSRNNTFIATSARSSGNDSIERQPNVVKCASAGAVEGLMHKSENECSNLVDVLNIGDKQHSESHEKSCHLEVREAIMPPLVVEEASKKPSAIPVKSKSYVGRINAQRSFISGSDSKTIKFLLKLTTKSYYEALKYEIDRIKENDRKIQDHISSQAQSIMTLISKGIDFDRKMEDLRAQNDRLLLESIEKDRVQLNTVNAITSEINELKSVCNLLLKNIEKDRELEILARKLHRSKRFDSNTYKMLRSQIRHPVRRHTSKTTLPKLSPKSSVTSLSKLGHKETMPLKRHKHSRNLSAKQKSDWSSFSSMSSVKTGSDMLTDIELTSDKKSSSTEISRRSAKPIAVTTHSLSEHNMPEKQEVKTKKRSGIMKIFCCGIADKHRTM